MSTKLVRKEGSSVYVLLKNAWFYKNALYPYLNSGVGYKDLAYGTYVTYIQLEHAFEIEQELFCEKLKDLSEFLGFVNEGDIVCDKNIKNLS